MGSKLIILAVIAALAVGGFLLVNNDSDDAETNSSSSTSSANQTSQANEDAPTTTPTFTLAEVATHSTPNDCWTVINGKVYDLSDYRPSHPGGDSILQACGEDGTTLFTQRTTTDGEPVGSGEPHSGAATAALEPLYQGDLVE